MRRRRIPEILCIRKFTFPLRTRAADTIKNLKGWPAHRQKTNRVLKSIYIYRKGAHSIPRSNFTHSEKCSGLARARREEGAIEPSPDLFGAWVLVTVGLIPPSGSVH